MTELQNDRMIDRTKTICPPNFDLRGIKIHRSVYNWFFQDKTNLAVTLNVTKNRQYDGHIPYKTQKCKGIHLTVKAQIMTINSLHPADFKKYWELILVSLILFINYYDVQAWFAFFTDAGSLIKIMTLSTSQAA